MIRRRVSTVTASVHCRGGECPGRRGLLPVPALIAGLGPRQRGAPPREPAAPPPQSQEPAAPLAARPADGRLRSGAAHGPGFKSRSSQPIGASRGTAQRDRRGHGSIRPSESARPALDSASRRHSPYQCLRGNEWRRRRRRRGSPQAQPASGSAANAAAACRRRPAGRRVSS